jgi:hypothetical protein
VGTTSHFCLFDAGYAPNQSPEAGSKFRLGHRYVGQIQVVKPVFSKFFAGVQTYGWGEHGCWALPPPDNLMYGSCKCGEFCVFPPAERTIKVVFILKEAESGKA